MNNFVFSTLLFCLIATAIDSSMNLLPVFNTLRTDGGRRWRGYCCSSTGCIGYIRSFCAADTSLLLYTLLCLCRTYCVLLLYLTDQWAVYLFRQDLSCNQQQWRWCAGWSIRFGCAFNSFLHYFETALGASSDFPYTSSLDSFLDSYIYEIARGRILIFTCMQERGVALPPRSCTYVNINILPLAISYM